MIVQNKNNIGNPYRDEKGQFASAGAGGSRNSSDTATTSSQKPMPAWLKKSSDGKTQLPSWLKKNDTNGNTQKNSLWQKIKDKAWWQNRDNVRTPDEVTDQITKFFDTEVLDFMEKYNFKTCDPMGAGKTSHAHLNTVLTNIIAKKMFKPLNVLDTKEFDDIWNRMLNQNGGWNTRKIPYNDFSTIERGFHNKDIIKQYLGEDTSNPVVLPNGCYGSCIYTAYDHYTAQSYAGRGYVMSFLVNNIEGHTITGTDYDIKKQQLISNTAKMEKNITDHLRSQGKDDNYVNNVLKVFRNTLTKDYTFAGVLMGYDAIYDSSTDYCLLLNFGNAYTKKDW